MSYSVDKKNNSLNPFCSSDMEDIDKLIIKYAYHNPRHMIQFCDRIVRYTARKAYSSDFLITKPIFDNALSDFCKWICINIYPKKFLSALVEFGKLEIYDNEFADSNRISVDKARKVLNEMARLGALKAKTVLSGETSYKVCDPRVSFIVESKVEIE